MDSPVVLEQLKKEIRSAVQSKFADLVANVKSGPGSLSDVAAQLGVTRQMLAQYATGSTPGCDVLLTAFLKWDWVVRVENLGDKPGWCEFSVSDMEGGIKKRRPEPIQLSLFDALTDLDQNIDTLKKSAGRVEVEIRRTFGKRA